MSRDRWSVSNVLRQTRGAIGSLEHAAIRYRRDPDVALRLQVFVLRALREAERQLRFALRDARAANQSKSKRSTPRRRAA